MSKTIQRVVTILILLSSLSLPLTAQSGGKKESLIHRVGRYVQGEPWRFDSVLPTTHTKYLVRLGGTGVKDEYLSPISHSGLYTGVSILTDGRMSGREDRWHYYGEIDLSFGLPKNASNKTTMHIVSGRYLGGPAYRMLNSSGWTVDVAPTIAAQIQGNMKLTNANNIMNIKGSLGLDAWARVMYRIPWEVMPIHLSYSAQLPLLHLAYHPHFGQSYFEYVSGENRVWPKFYFAAPHNTLSLRQRLLVDLPIRSHTITLGVEHYHMRQELNSTKFRHGAWSVMLGISLDHLHLSGNRSTRSSQVLSPMHTY